jgi:hypothetical protein
VDGGQISVGVRRATLPGVLNTPSFGVAIHVPLFFAMPARLSVAWACIFVRIVTMTSAMVAGWIVRKSSHQCLLP